MKKIILISLLLGASSFYGYSCNDNYTKAINLFNEGNLTLTNAQERYAKLASDFNTSESVSAEYACSEHVELYEMTNSAIKLTKKSKDTFIEILSQCDLNVKYRQKINDIIKLAKSELKALKSNKQTYEEYITKYGCYDKDFNYYYE